MIRVMIVGTGGMAHDHARAYAAMDGVSVVAGVDTNPENLAAFQKEFGIPNGFDSVSAALAWGDFDAVSNVTPDGVHHRTTMPLLAAGKHVLCEKPLAAMAADAAEMATAAQAAGVVNMVNLTYRNVPALMAGADIVASGEIGEVRHFEASYLQSWLTQPAWGDWKTEDQWLWRLSSAHGSLGVLGDVGVHILDYATFAAGSGAADVSCRLTTFPKAEGNRIGAYVLDANDSFSMHLTLANGAAGVIHATRFASGHLNDLRLRLYGTQGGLEVLFEGGKSQLRKCTGANLEKAEWQEVATPDVDTNYVRFIKAIQSGDSVRPDFTRGAALQRVLDRAVESNADSCRSLPV
ncbi:Predicted dehydrogenase [Cognatiyoonia koreensis]|uniref:Predicted dehydrogenase n=1 Tax=Cognatiyoonia koreensis TaxID=364200 RepID=A0A1I0RKH1_9RHOB|nr:Gfo/Idh/MocA family oxidoreductase [Cognatiyoonia koreensis]SEW41470.1 Predicted dehydrogenase [Cognatiyoonia koreensis]